VHTIQDNQDYSVRNCNVIGRDLERDNDQVYHQEYGVTCYDPPVDSGALICQEIETTLDNQLSKGSLLHHSRDSNITDTEEDRIHNDETLCC